MSDIAKARVEPTDIAKVRGLIEAANVLLEKLELAWCIDHTLYDGRDVEVWCSKLPAVRAALDRIEAGGAEGWQDMASAPKDATHVLLWWPHWYHVPVTGYYDLAHGWQSEYAIADDGVEPLNWRPLPPPQPEKEGKFLSPDIQRLFCCTIRDLLEIRDKALDKEEAYDEQKLSDFIEAVAIFRFGMEAWERERHEGLLRWARADIAARKKEAT